MAWLEEDVEGRKSNLVELMNCVRFANISSYYFCDKIDTNPLLRENPELLQLMDTIRCYHMLKNRQQEMDVKLMPRRGMAYERGVMIIANPYTEDMLKKYNSMELLLPKTGEVIHICKLPQSLYTPGGNSALSDKWRKEYLPEYCVNSVEIFDPNDNTWSQGPSLSNALCGA
ncbi:UPF0672 protein C3orf58, partial [Elysia marginata]